MAFGRFVSLRREPGKQDGLACLKCEAEAAQKRTLKDTKNFVHNTTQPNTMRLNAGQMGTEDAGSEGEDDGGVVAMEAAAVEESHHKRR